MAHRRLSWHAVWLGFRSAFWAALLPGFFAGYVPWRFFGLDRASANPFDAIHAIGLLAVGSGAGLLLACIWAFARAGGTLAPVDPPRELVVRGLYRYVRNPMYLSVTTIVLGEILLTRSLALLVYWVIWFIAVNLFVVGYEEPTLRRSFGASYDRYAQRVGRWIPRLRGDAID